MTLRYWAVKPKTFDPSYARIEKAASSYEACRLAFGRPISPEVYHAKDLGSTIKIVRSDKQRIAAIRDPDGWVDLSKKEN
ncbi:MAG: hypothetical protein KGO96_10430 [Elusimicrobia bacterium]|nr:hypothetical protein [Elusimicrobiota bacterium]